MCKQCELRVNAGQGGIIAQARRYDPTHTTMLRQRFERDFNRRFNELMRLIRETLVDNDALGLGPRVMASAAGRRAFDFPRSADKVAAFMTWLRAMQEELLFEVRVGRRAGVAGEQIWADLYIDTAYQRGLASASSALRGAGVEVGDRWIESAFYRPIHADPVGLIYTRTYSDLRGITEAMDAQISRVLAQGLAEGLSSDRIARGLNDRVEKIGKVRSRMLARTEVVAAHAEASLNTYEEAGIEGVSLQAEFLTARDERVCEQCSALASGGPYSVQEARGLIPAHPNCRCAWVPIVSNPGAVRLVA